MAGRALPYIKFAGALLSIAAAAACLSGCGNSAPAELAGHWVLFEGAAPDKPGELELFKNGTGYVGDGGLIKWKVENKRLVIIAPAAGGMAVGYAVSGDKLVIAYDGGDSAVFVNKEKIGEYRERRAQEKIKEASVYVTDSRDGRKYRAVKIGGKTWMAENLNLKTDNSWCYNDADSNCVKYGRMYDLAAAKTVCLPGWHLPTRRDWGDLIAAAGGPAAGRNLKAASGWHGGGNGTDEFGFSALPGGGRDGYGGFGSAGDVGIWWTAMEAGGNIARSWHMTRSDDLVSEFYNEKGHGFSVRCVEN